MRILLSLIFVATLLGAGSALAGPEPTSKPLASSPSPTSTTVKAPTSTKVKAPTSTTVKAPTKPRTTFKRKPGVRYVKQPLRIGASWDFQFEQGVIVKFADGDGPLSRRFFGRVRAGFLFAHEPWIVALGAIMEGSGVPSLAFGLQLEVTHLWRGLWGQVSVSMDGDAHTFTALSAGFSLLGFEWQKRFSAGGTLSSAFLLKVRIPVGIFFFAR